MAYQSKNMSYIFYTEYFEGMDLGKLSKKEDVLLKEKNEQLLTFQFRGETPAEHWKALEDFQEVSLYTTYPGLLIGAGNEHSLAKDGALKMGFSFDHVTGLPFIPGSSVKGVLRSYFPGDYKNEEEKAEYRAYIQGILGKENVDVEALQEEIFEGGDVFLGAFPEVPEKGVCMLGMDYITPHKEKFADPNPISFLKVKPNVKFCFGFLLKDSKEVTAGEKRMLFETILLDMGIGAKTNVGFGRFSKERTKDVADYSPKDDNGGKNFSGQNRGGGGKPRTYSFGDDTKAASPFANICLDGGNSKEEAPTCKNAGCSNKVTKNRKTDKWNLICQSCFNKKRR